MKKSFLLFALLLSSLMGMAQGVPPYVPRTTFSGGGGSGTSNNASDLSTGTVPDDRLAPQVVRIDAIQTLKNKQIDGSLNAVTNISQASIIDLVNVLSNKVNKVTGKDLSTNDLTNLLKAKYDSVSSKVDRVSGKQLSTNDLTNLLKARYDSVSQKVNKVNGKDLSTNDYTTTEKNKLLGIASGATANDTDANLKSRSNHTGTQSASTITEITDKRFMQDAERTKLAGIASGATANSSDSQLRDRGTHTGSQAASTILEMTDKRFMTDGERLRISRIEQIAQNKADSTAKRVPFDNIRMRKTINTDGDSTAVPRETFYSTVGRADSTKRGLNNRIDSLKTVVASQANGPVQRISREYVLASHNFVSTATGPFVTTTISGSVSTYTQGMPIGRLSISTGSSSATGSAFLGGSNNTLTMGTGVRHAWEVVYTVPVFSDTTNTFQAGIGFDQGTSDLVHFLGWEVQNATVRAVSRRGGTEQGSTPTQASFASVNVRYRARVEIIYNASTTNYDVKYYLKPETGFTPVSVWPWSTSDVLFTRSLASGQLPSGPLAPCIIDKKSKGTSGAGQINVEQVIYSYIFP